MAARGKITGYFSSNTGNGDGGEGGNGDGGEGGNGSRKRARIEGGAAADARSYGTSKHAVGYKPAWEAEYPWLVPDFSDGKVSGMLCSVCKRHSTKNKYNKTTAWSESPCICLRKDSVRRHASSVQHSNAVELEKVRVAAEREGGIPQAFEAEVSLQKQAIKGAMQCLYWLVYSEIPHTTKYSSLVDAVQFMGCEHFKLLHRSENAKYKSERIIQEFPSGHVRPDQTETATASFVQSILQHYDR